MIKKVKADRCQPLPQLFIRKQREVVTANRDPNTTEWKCLGDESGCSLPIILPAGSEHETRTLHLEK